MKYISTDSAPAAIGPYTQAIKSGGLLFVSGQTPLVPETMELAEGGIKEQTEQVMKNIGGILKAAGCDYSNIVKAVCFLTDMGDFAAFNEIYSKYITEKPARSCIAVKALPREASVEVEVIAELEG